MRRFATIVATTWAGVGCAACATRSADANVKTVWGLDVSDFIQCVIALLYLLILIVMIFQLRVASRTVARGVESASHSAAAASNSAEATLLTIEELIPPERADATLLASFARLGLRKLSRIRSTRPPSWATAQDIVQALQSDLERMRERAAGLGDELVEGVDAVDEALDRLLNAAKAHGSTCIMPGRAGECARCKQPLDRLDAARIAYEQLAARIAAVRGGARDHNPDE